MSGRRPSRRQAVALLGAAACVGRAARAGAPAPPRLRRGVSAWPWFALTREYPAPRRDYAWPPFEPDRAVPTRRDVDLLRDLGLDFVRIPVDPGPFVSVDGELRRHLLEQVIAAVGTVHEAGLSAIVDVHPNDATHHYTSAFFTDGPGGPGLALYLDLLRSLAERLSRLDPGRTLLELMNEPPQSCADSSWPVLQREMIAAVRAVAPALWLVATGACGGTVPGLEALQPDADERVIYTFHLYEPYVFTHQGAPWMTGEPIYRYLKHVPWPGDAGSRADTMASARARLAADKAMPPAEKVRIGRELDRVLDEYFDAHPARPFVEGFVARVRSWGDTHGVAPERLLLGEFGALRSDARYDASRPEDRARFIRDMRLSAEAHAIAWCYWNLFDGFTLFRSDDDRRPDPAVVVALGLRPPER